MKKTYRLKYYLVDDEPTEPTLEDFGLGVSRVTRVTINGRSFDLSDDEAVVLLVELAKTMGVEKALYEIEKNCLDC